MSTVLLLLLSVYFNIISCFPNIQEVALDYHSSHNRIVGGIEAEDGEFPWQVSMQHKGLFGWSHMCGGSIHSESYVITAGHCTFGQTADKIKVIAGTNIISNLTDAEAQQIQADALILHEHFDTVTRTNDISLIHLEAPLAMNNNVQAVALPEQFGFIAAGTECTVSGWGALQEGALGMSDVLMKIKVPVVTDEKCRESYGITEIGDAMICAGVEDGGRSPCLGDSGGPLMCDGILHGLVSWGQGCADTSPGVYTELAYYRDWIDQHAV